MLLWEWFITLCCQLSKIYNVLLLKLLLADCVSIHCNQQCDHCKPWVVCTRFLIIWGLSHCGGKFFCPFIMKSCKNMPINFIMSACHCSWTDFYEIWYWRVLLKPVNTFQFWLKADHSNDGRRWMTNLTGNNKFNVPEILLCTRIF
jgi:hypothetical protein